MWVRPPPAAPPNQSARPIRAGRVRAVLPGPDADVGDRVAELVLDAIDAEPPELRSRLLEAIKRDRHHVKREPDRVLVWFATVDHVAYEVPLARIPGSSGPRRVN